MSWLIKGVVVLAVVTMSTAAFADDWVAVKLRGGVLQEVDGKWLPIKLNDVIPDNRIVRTASNGHVEFSRGQETIDLDASTQIQIHDTGSTAKPFTSVKQYFGTVAVEAQVENVQHFSVDTPFLAAVVKGTKFVVSSDKTSSSVKVNRGHVAVEDLHDHSHVTLAVGQSAKIDSHKTGAIVVSGTGALPAVLDAAGAALSDAVPAAEAADESSGKSNSAKAADNSGNGSANSNGNSGNAGGNSSSSNGNSGSSNSNSGNSDNSGHGHSGDHEDHGKHHHHDD